MLRTPPGSWYVLERRSMRTLANLIVHARLQNPGESAGDDGKALPALRGACFLDPDSENTVSGGLPADVVASPASKRRRGNDSADVRPCDGSAQDTDQKRDGGFFASWRRSNHSIVICLVRIASRMAGRAEQSFASARLGRRSRTSADGCRHSLASIPGGMVVDRGKQLDRRRTSFGGRQDCETWPAFAQKGGASRGRKTGMCTINVASAFSDRTKGSQGPQHVVRKSRGLQTPQTRMEPVGLGLQQQRQQWKSARRRKAHQKAGHIMEKPVPCSTR